MLAILGIWMALGVGLEIGHQIDKPSTRVVGVVGRVVAWPAAAVEQGNEPEPAPTGVSRWVEPPDETI